MKVGSSLSPGNYAANLAKQLLLLVDEEKDSFELFSHQITNWLLSIIDIGNNTSNLREKQCELFIALGQNAVYRESWKRFLTTVGIESHQGSDMLFQNVITRAYHISLLWRNKVLLKSIYVHPPSASLTKEEEKVLRYVAGFIPFSLKKIYQYKNSPIAKAVLDLIKSWMMNKEEEQEDSMYAYTKSWIDRIDRGGLMVVNEQFYVFIKRIECVARHILNKKLMVEYHGEDLRDVLMDSFTSSELVDKSWCSLTRNIESNELRYAIKMLIFKKWIGIRANSFAKAWVQVMKVKARKTGKKISNQSEPSFRKTLHTEKKKKNIVK